MDRRSFLKTTGAAAAAGATGVGLSAAESLAAPAIVAGIRELRLASALPADLPGIDGFRRRLAERLEALSGGRMRLAAGAQVAPDPAGAVVAGDADIALQPSLQGHGRSTAHALLSGLPCWLHGERVAAWLSHGGGQLLWDELAAGEGLKPFAGGHGGPMRGLWARQEVASLSGRRIAATGGTALVLSALGAEVEDVPTGDLADRLGSGRIAAAVGIDPMIDLMLGLPGVARHHVQVVAMSAGTQLAAAASLSFWEQHTNGEKAILEAAIEGAGLALTRELAAQAGMALGTFRARGLAITEGAPVLGYEAAEASEAVIAGLQRGSGMPASRLAASYAGFARLTSSPWPAEMPQV